jgi:pectin methylesterase-like acyl-CoA thioesterase
MMMFGSSSALVGSVLSFISLTSAVVAAAHAAAPHPATTFAECQEKTSNPLQGCPEGTVFVSANDTRADFTRIQDAILSIGNDTEPHYILIGAGIYYERKKSLEGRCAPMFHCFSLTRKPQSST